MGWTLMIGVAAAGAGDLRALEGAALAALEGPAGCHRMRLEVDQSGSIPLLGSDRERLRAHATLRDGIWSGIDVTVLADSDPDEALFEGEPTPFGEPGVGQMAGDAALSEADLSDDALLWLALLEPAQEIRWVDGRLERWTPVPGEDLIWRSSVRFTDGRPSQWRATLEGDPSSALEWELSLDAGGLPARERSEMTLSMLGLSIDVEQSITYRSLGACR